MGNLILLFKRECGIFTENLQREVPKLAPRELEGAADVDEVETRLVEEAGLDTEFQRAVAKEVFRIIRQQLEEERIKKMKTEKRKDTKRGPAGLGDGNEILEDVASAYNRHETAKRNVRLGVDYKNFMDWKVSIMEALKLTFFCMAKMLSIVAMLGMVAWAVVVMASIAAAGQELGSSTNSTGVRAEGGGDEGNMATTTLMLMASALIGTVMTYSAIQALLNMQMPRSYASLWLAFAGAMTCLWAYFELGGSRLSGKVLGATFVVASAMMGGLFGFSVISEGESLNVSNYLLKKAAKRAAHVLGGGEGELKKTSVKKRLKISLMFSLPTLVNFAVLMILVVGILTLFQQYESVWWKIFVTMLALGIKICGNKALLGLLGNLPTWVCDFHLYGYEFSTALLVRILQLSFPDENTAMLMGLFGAVVEVGTRIFFYSLFLKKGLANPRMTDEEKKKYAQRGKLRVQDASNDMVVEYMSSIVAGLFMIYLEPTGLFRFAATARKSAKTIVKLCAFQIVPELFLDFYVTFMEIYGGLKDLHVSYWKMGTGGEKDSKYWVLRLGDLPKATVVKVTITWGFTAFVAMTCLK